MKIVDGFSHFTPPEKGGIKWEKPLTILVKSSIVDVRLGSKSSSKLNCLKYVFYGGINRQWENP